MADSEVALDAWADRVSFYYQCWDLFAAGDDLRAVPSVPNAFSGQGLSICNTWTRADLPVLPRSGRDGTMGRSIKQSSDAERGTRVWNAIAGGGAGICPWT